jgi:hypothetical protein
MSPTNYFGEPDDLQASWSRWQIYADLCTRQDIPAALNVSLRQVERWITMREHYKIPFPVRHLAHLDVYSMRDWVEWFEQWEADHPRASRFNPRKRFR